MSQIANEIRICPVCGVVAPGAAGQCEVCQSPLGVRGHTVTNLLPGRPWARLELTVPCPRCGTTLAPRPDAIEEGLSCHGCGERSMLDVAWWDEVVHLAHAVVDLGSPDYYGLNAALGAFNPFAAVGAQVATTMLPNERVPLQSTMQARVGPGAPLCVRCATPLGVRFLSHGRYSTECSRCGDREAFATPPSLLGRVVTLRAVVSFAPEAAAAAGRIEPWWLLLEGTSSMRAMVQQQQEEAAAAAANQAAWAAWDLQERERQERERQLQEAQNQRGEAERQRREKESREKAERDGLQRTLRETHAKLEETTRTLDATRREYAETRQSLETALAESQAAHQNDIAMLQQEAWQQSQQMQATLSQREHAWRQGDAAKQAEMDALAKKHKTRWRIAIGLWVLFFAVVALDVALSLSGS